MKLSDEELRRMIAAGRQRRAERHTERPTPWYELSTAERIAFARKHYCYGWY